MSNIRFLIIILALTTILSGCGTKPAPEAPKPPAAPVVGVIDINAAIKSHPKYKELMVLQKQGNAMMGQLEAEQIAKAEQAAEQEKNMQQMPVVTPAEIDELNKALEQEYTTRLTAKEREVNEKLASKVASTSRTLNDELKAYNDQLEKEYQPQIFNLQLKLKIVQLTKEEAAVIQKDLDNLQAKRTEALNQKNEELSKRMDEIMAVEKGPLEQELVAYRQEVDAELAKKMNAKQAEFLNRVNEQHQPTVITDKVASKVPEQLAILQQQIEKLQGDIVDNINDKTAQVAIASGFEIVLTNVAVNVSAVDITKQVITECNK